MPPCGLSFCQKRALPRQARNKTPASVHLASFQLVFLGPPWYPSPQRDLGLTKSKSASHRFSDSPARLPRDSEVCILPFFPRLALPVPPWQCPVGGNFPGRLLEPQLHATRFSCMQRLLSDKHLSEGFPVCRLCLMTPHKLYLPSSGLQPHAFCFLPPSLH